MLLLLLACENPFEEDAIPAPCAERAAFYLDQDGDGAGDLQSPYIGCAAPEGYVSEAGDCNDADATVQTGCDTGDTSGESG